MIRRDAKVFAADLRRTEPTPEEMRKINRFSRVALNPQDVYVGECDLANDRVDRTFEWFPVGVLNAFAKTAPGKSLLGGHDYGSLPLGLWYDAEVRRDGDGNTLVARYYIAKTADNEHDRRQIDAGVWRYASIGFTASDLVCDLCGASMYGFNGKLCSHRPGEKYTITRDDGKDAVDQECHYHYETPAEMVEGSIVYLGAQFDAEIKAAPAADGIYESDTLTAMMAAREAEYAVAVHGAMLFAKSADGAGIIVPRAPKAEAKGEDAEEEADGEKPYPNEHACRLRDPGDFQADSFRRTTRDHEGKEYSVIMGRLEGEDTMTEQAYRYAKTVWDADEARSHCESHDGSFEAASGESAEDEADEGKAVSVVGETEIDEAAIAKAIAEMKIGRVLSRKNEDKIRQASALLAEVLSSLDKEKPVEEGGEEGNAPPEPTAKDAGETSEGGGESAPDPKIEEQALTSAQRLSQILAEQIAEIIAANTVVREPLPGR